jgi:predicted Holliday junction resolvase-like endonuclease
MTNPVVSLFALQSQVFGVCPCCGELFRLSDCELFSGLPPAHTWFDSLEEESAVLDEREEALEMRLEQLREAARSKGRRKAQQTVARVDRIFSPLKLHADDAKTICHPIDYVVFDGLSRKRAVTRLVLLDRDADSITREKLQGSVRRAIEHGNIVWSELHVSDQGVVTARR